MENFLQEIITKAVRKSFPKEKDLEIILETPNEPKFGDFSTNIAMQLAKKQKKNPQEVAQVIVDNIPKDSALEKIEIAGPGFINFTFSFQFLREQLQQFSAEKQLTMGKGIKISIDSSHPNIAKPLHFGHLRSTILGEALARIWRHLGYEVLQDNFLGDWGTQFGKLVVAIHKWGDKKKIAENPIPELVRLYQKFHKEAEEDPDLNKQGAEEFRKMEVDRDEENLKLWRWIVDESMKEVQEFYDLMDAHFDVIRGESHWEKIQDKTLELLQEKGVAVEGEGGALVVHFPEETKLPTMIYRRSDGATLYQTRDLTRILYYDREGYHILPHIVGNDQSLHFRQVFQTAKMLGAKVLCEHDGFGLYRIQEGKMSTRKGNIVELMDVFAEAQKRVQKILEERRVDFSDREKEQLGKILAVGAVKFNDLSQNRNTDVVFDWDRMLSFEGFSAPFLQYSYARARSIFRKNQERDKIDFGSQDFIISEEPERRLTKKILDFPGIVMMAADKRMPHFICQYLYELASTFNYFYSECPILPASIQEKKARLFLTGKMCETLKQGLYLLSIEVPERM